MTVRAPGLGPRSRRYDHETAERMARRKAGEFEDPESAKVLEERKKTRLGREKRDREGNKERSRNQPKRFKSGASYWIPSFRFIPSSGFR